MHAIGSGLRPNAQGNVGFYGKLDNAERDNVVQTDQSYVERYNNVHYSPSFLEDGIAIVGSGAAFLQRSTDGGWTFKPVKAPVQNNTNAFGDESMHGVYKPVPHTIAFSPNFATDQTVFVSGFNMHVSVSKDGGATFTKLWDANGVQKFGSFCKLHLSPTFGVDDDQTILADVRSDAYAGYSEPISQEERHHLFEPAQTGSVLYLSKDGGETWKRVSKMMPFLDVALAPDGSVLATFGSQEPVSRPNEGDSLPAYEEPLDTSEKLHARVASLSGKAKTVPAGQLMVMRAPLREKREFELVSNAQLEVRSKTQKLGGQALSISPQGDVVAGWENGGTLTGRLSGSELLDREIIAVPGMGDLAAKHPVWFQQIMPGACALRGQQPLIAYNEQGIFVGGTGYGIVVSLDGGHEWHKVWSVPTTTTEPSDLLPGCKVRRNTENSITSSFDTMNLGWSDSGSYCLVCESGFKRDPLGTCNATGTIFRRSMLRKANSRTKTLSESD
jgi:hypothetical protein